MKPKMVNWQLIEDETLSSFVQDLITRYHEDINGVICVFMWRYNVKQDPDGFILLADISKSADKMRELRPHDMIIGINKDAWSILDDVQKSVIIDCQLERIAVSRDKDDEPKEDDRSRTVYRLRRREVVEDNVLQRRHTMDMHAVHEFVFDRFNAGESKKAEKGSHIAEVLSS